jgi:hypothetical protein
MKYVNSSHQNATHVRMFGPDGNFEYQEIIGKTNDSIRIQTPRGSVWLSYLNCEQLFGVCCWYRKVKEQENPVVKLFTKGNLDTSVADRRGGGEVSGHYAYALGEYVQVDAEELVRVDIETITPKVR